MLLVQREMGSRPSSCSLLSSRLFFNWKALTWSLHLGSICVLANALKVRLCNVRAHNFCVCKTSVQWDGLEDEWVRLVSADVEG
eukprot:4452857-Amphidinium_carterae.1